MMMLGMIAPTLIPIPITATATTATTTTAWKMATTETVAELVVEATRSD